MNIKTWESNMDRTEERDLAYWERNVLALHFADGWYYDDVYAPLPNDRYSRGMIPRYPGRRRVLTLEDGAITFHIPDDFDIGNLPQIKPNWDGHTTEQKWTRILEARGVKVTTQEQLDTLIKMAGEHIKSQSDVSSEYEAIFAKNIEDLLK